MTKHGTGPKQGSAVIDRLLIVGTGLIGGSIGLAAKEVGIARTVVGFDADVSSRIDALARGAIDIAAETLASALTDVSLVILCVPPRAMVAVATEIGRWHKQPLLMSDVCSVKEGVVHQIASITAGTNIRFVPAHPIAGAVNQGIEFARSDLFAGRPTTLTPGSKDLQTDIDLLTRFWTSLGSHVRVMSVEAHDEFFAVSSHLPHLTAFALSICGLDAFSASMVDCIPKSFLETTRVAKAAPELWSDILATNAEAVVQASRLLRQRVEELEGYLMRGERDAVKNLLRRANEFRRTLD